MMHRRSLTALSAAALLTVAATASAQSGNYNASRTFQFDPDKLGCSVAEWKNGTGQADANGNTNFGLKLEKNCPTSEVVAAGAVLNGVKGTVLFPGPSLGFDYKAGSPCTGGAPRFNVSASDGFHFIGGCGNGTPGTAPTVGWNRVTFNPYDPTQAFPPLAPNATILSIVLIIDEQGAYLLDNIQVNGLYADKPGAAK